MQNRSRTLEGMCHHSYHILLVTHRPALAQRDRAARGGDNQEVGHHGVFLISHSHLFPIPFFYYFQMLGLP